MTLLAGDVSADMRHMRERHKIRLTEDLYPGDRLLPIPISLQLPDLRPIGSGDLMASHAELDGWDTRDRGSAGIGMAIQTRDSIVTGVDLMAEIDRLRRYFLS
jgi:hypothetical protein